ncbi:MAG: type II toxin-antitoxin system RelE/ParE family toxin [Anaerolineaceae bacterium]
MIEIRETQYYRKWFSELKDRKARARIDARLRKVSLGNLGDVKPVGKGVSELRIDYGPGYRLYILGIDKTIVILLCGGDKSSQSGDIEKAQKLALAIRSSGK